MYIDGYQVSLDIMKRSQTVQHNKPYLNCFDLWKETVQTHLYPLFSQNDSKIDMDKAESVTKGVTDEMDR